MKHFTSSEYWEAFDALPQAIQKKAREKYELLKDNQFHPSLRLKKIEDYWSVRIGIRYRALGIQDGEDVLWFWIGHHKVYDELIK